MIEHTPERMVPETYSGPAFWEHVMRYRFACRHVRGLDVLDIACGEGYGTAGMAKVAKSCIGVDCVTEVVAHARAKYQFQTGVFVCAVFISALRASWMYTAAGFTSSKMVTIGWPS